MPEPRVVVFNANETMSDAEAEQAELSEGSEQQPSGEQPATQAQPEGQTQPVAEGEPPNKTGVIPYSRFKEVNDRRVALEKEATELRERWARLEERQKVAREEREATQRQQEAAAKAAERPDPTVDPIGAELWDLKEWKKNQEQAFTQLQTKFNESITGIQQNQDASEFNNWVAQNATNYRAQHPEYDEVAKHSVDWRKKFWKELGPNAPDEAIQQIVEKESFLIAAWAKQFGGNFAPVIHRLGVQMGWQAPQAQNGNGNGVAQSQNQQRLQQVKAGQAVQGLGRVPGAGSEATTSYRNYTPLQIADMSEKEFQAAKADPKKWADLQYAIAQAEGIDAGEIRI